MRSNNFNCYSTAHAQLIADYKTFYQAISPLEYARKFAYGSYVTKKPSLLPRFAPHLALQRRHELFVAAFRRRSFLH